MKRFRFRLAAVRDLRRLEERTALLAVGRALRAVKEAEDGVARLLTERRELGNALAARLARAPGAEEDHPLDALARALVRVERLDTSLAAARRRVEESQRSLVLARERHRERRAAREAFDRLEARDRKDYERERERRERDQMDEVAVARFVRREVTP